MTDNKIFGGEEEVVVAPKQYLEGAIEYDNDEKRLALLEKFHKDKYLAHDVLFEHRRKDKTPEFHHDILKLFYSSEQYCLASAFRGGAKSTLVEEYTILALLFKDARFAIIIGNSYERACERLAAIKHELETNENLIELFGNQVGPTWSVDVIVLANGARVQAFGARQSLRGAKHMDARPDLAVVDDLEDDDMVATELARQKSRRWFDGSLKPALTPTGKIRMVGTPLHPKSLLEENRLSINRATGQHIWKSLVVPIYYMSGAEEIAAWPGRFSMKFINDAKQSYISSGAITEFEQEYMCRAEDQASKPFQASMFKKGIAPVGYSAVEIMVDPARTVNTKTSARTGYAVWAWTGNRLTVFEAYGRFHRPDEIIAEIFKLNDKYSPVNVGVEADGLEEFIMQPLRSEQVKRGVSIPLSPQRAPKDKNSFISGLQPFYMAGDVTHVGDCQDLENELAAFPTGRCDVPNALAYALKMRVGKPVYEDFGAQHIVDRLEVSKRSKRYLALSATPSMTAAALLQFRDDNIYVIQDWCRNEPAAEALPIILQEAALAAGDFTAVTPAEQMDKYVNNGIPGVFKTQKNRIMRGNLAAASIGGLSARLKTTNKGRPAFQVSGDAKWVINGMSRGYARKLLPTGSFADLPEKNQYSLVIEAIESFTSYLKNGMIEGDDELTRAFTPGGRAYFSSLPTKG
jgi:hypothetical protein